ncbi:39S ribosomal protein L20, mitochondrial [Hyalella azteca]|uniref:39S ribosomal protein L20, mitochondrial n=1 Tax=Hyalella azteca TaxID=294128 RepID=A0A8B7NQ46_HYAAZ|nr:39S ribosomal protein L20, mitochondrial [Hyalella azteca]
MVFIGRVFCGIHKPHQYMQTHKGWRMRGNPGKHKAWSRRRILRLSSHFYGRRNNCYSIAIKQVYRSLNKSRIGRKFRYPFLTRLWEQRLDAACEELGYSWPGMRVHLREAGVALSKSVLQNLAIYEPRTFRSLVSLAKSLDPDPGMNSLQGPPPSIITKGMI